MFTKQTILTRAIAVLGMAALWASSACTQAEVEVVEGPGEAQAPVLSIADPTEPVTNMELVENLSEEVADWLLEYSDTLKRRNFEAARTWLADDFEGHGISPLEGGETKDMPLGVHKLSWKPESAQVVGPDAFMGSVTEVLASWQRVEQVLWKVKGAEFQGGRRTWGKIKLKIVMTGSDGDLEPIAVSGWAYMKVSKQRGEWKVNQFTLTSMGVKQRAGGPLFTNVAAAAGVAHSWPRFGTEENLSYAWNGAAGGDVDGDGDWDLFVPSDGRNYLYLAKDDGSFEEAAEARGVAQPAAGTGTVFFDFDNDGDQDLLVAHIGWMGSDGKLEGQTLQLYINDGAGNFANQSGMAGLQGPMDAYHVTVLDYDADGFLDLFVACYGRLEAEHNDSWIEATNGSQNVLLRNMQGKGFEDTSKAAGIAGGRWTYASACADVNQDGWLDIYAANDYGSNRMWINQKDGTFKDEADALGLADQGNGMACAFGDLNADGILDLYVSNMSSTAGNRILNRLTEEIDPEIYAALKKMAAGNSTFQGKADGTFERFPKEFGGTGGAWAWSLALNDFDLDGNLDVFCTNGFVTGTLPDDT
ncbi:MAG: VCBS repeat-containing protein [Planctomycetota bacterium]|nr:VCBS repeat-containing protein [Planctomycetota bacterium]